MYRKFLQEKSGIAQLFIIGSQYQNNEVLRILDE